MSTQPETRLGILDQVSNPYFLLCLLLAVVVVFLSAKQKFGEATAERRDDDYIAQLLPKYLATREEYSGALIWYIATMIFIVIVMSLLGRPVLGLGGAQVPDVAYAAPLFVALVMLGLIPQVPWLQQLEPKIRKFWHERAFIPAAARATAEKLAAAEFDFSRYRSDEILALPAMDGVKLADLDRPRGSLEYSWARLSCLSYELDWRRQEGRTEALDPELLDKYASDLNNIVEKRAALKEDVAQYRKAKRRNAAHTNEQLHRTIRNLSRQLYVLLGCAVRMKLRPDADIAAALTPFGFELKSNTRREGHHDLITVGLAVMAICLLVLVFAAYGLGALLEHFRLLKLSTDFPRGPLDAFIWSGTAVLTHGVAIWVAENIRARRISAGRWFGSSGGMHANSANHVRVALACAIAGYATYLVLGLIIQGEITKVLLTTAAAFALLPAATGGFYAYHLDNVELGRRPPRWREIGSQTLATGLCGLVAAHNYAAVTGAGNAYDYIALVTLMGMIVGASLAWYIPAAAQTENFDPLAQEQAARLAMLRAAAVRRFPSAEQADLWLEQRHPALGDMSPSQAAADVEGFEHAIWLLQRPALAA